MAIQIQIRRDTSAQWIVVDPVLSEGEQGLELDTGRLKFGDGVLPWSSLPYFITLPVIFGVVDPEGVVIGSVGQFYKRTDTGELWVKQTGSGNTGWI